MQERPCLSGAKVPLKAEGMLRSVRRKPVPIGCRVTTTPPTIRREQASRRARVRVCAPQSTSPPKAGSPKPSGDQSKNEREEFSGLFRFPFGKKEEGEKRNKGVECSERQATIRVSSRSVSPLQSISQPTCSNCIPILNNNNKTLKEILCLMLMFVTYSS